MTNLGTNFDCTIEISDSLFEFLYTIPLLLLVIINVKSLYFFKKTLEASK